MNGTVTISTEYLRFLHSLPLLLLAAFAISWLSFQSRRRLHSTGLAAIQRHFGIVGLPQGLFAGLIAIWAALLFVLLGGLFWVITDVIRNAWTPTPELQTALRGTLIAAAALTATLGAVVALPFTIVRLRLAATQTRTAEAGLLNDRIAKSVELLGSREVTVRVGAIYALESIMLDSESSRVRMRKIINAFLKHANSGTSSDNSHADTLREDLQAALDVLTRPTNE